MIVITGASSLARHVVDHYAAHFPSGEMLVVEERSRAMGKLAQFAKRRIRNKGYLSFADAVAMRVLEPVLTRLPPIKPGRLRSIPHLVVEDINDPAVATFATAHAARLIILNLCSVLSKEQLERFGIPIVNVHPGINPRYRGAGCLWALREGNFHLLGATLHHVDSGIDTGAPIAYAHVDPLLDHHDARSVFAAAQLAGADLAIRFANGRPIPPIPPEMVRLESRFYPYPGLTTWLRAWNSLRRAKSERRKKAS